MRNRTTPAEVSYRLPTGGRLEQEVRIAFLSDLHSEWYGTQQEALLAPLRRFAPDLVILGGDTFDERVPWEPAIAAITRMSNEWPVYYTPGNHEMKTGRAAELKTAARAAGAQVLAGRAALLPFGNSRLCLYGVEDPLHQEDLHRAQLQTAIHDAALAQGNGYYTVLITHRPERVSEYRGTPFDLILTGHAHGGQWRAPFLPNGFFAPDQGLFPRYTGGIYPLHQDGKTTRLLVSRGLARHNTRVPRIGDPPELVWITLEHEKKTR